MAYPNLPDRRMPYHRDGTVVLQRSDYPIVGTAQSYPPSGDVLAFNGSGGVATGRGASYGALSTIPFFPERREVTGIFYSIMDVTGRTVTGQVIYGSDDTTNGTDGTWELASTTIPSPVPAVVFDQWRSTIKSVSFTGPKKAIRLYAISSDPLNGSLKLAILHIYGEKAAGQTPDDLIFIDHDTTPGVEFTAPEDFGDRPLGTSLVRQFRVKNASATKTANTINLQCNDADFVISTDGTTWVATINITSLAAAAESATLYVRNTTPAPGNLLGPRFAEIVALVGSWT